MGFMCAKVTSNLQIHIKHVCGFDMAICGFDIKDTPIVIFLIVAQEFGAVLFNLVCGSRLGNHDYYYTVTDGASAANVSSISNASLSSMFVLFFTLHVFNGPYINLWLVSLDYICVQTKHRENMNAATKTTRLIAILIAHVIAVAIAYVSIPALRDAAKSTLTWQEITAPAPDKAYLGFIFMEEFIAVCTLLVGFLYLAWLRKPKEEEPPQVDIEFFMRLTFFVIACTRAFPSAHLSPHVSLYKLFSGSIREGEWGIRLGAGVLASAVVIVWDQFGRHRVGGDAGISGQDEEDVSAPLQGNNGRFTIEPTPEFRPNTNRPNTTRPQTAPPGGRPSTPASSLSISFAKQGMYF